MVFIAMDQDELLSRTAQYQIQYAHRRRDPSYFTQNEAPESNERDSRHILSIRHHDDGTTSRRSGRTYVYRPADEDEELYRLAQMPDEFYANQPDFRITTECSDAEDEPEGPRGFRRTPNRIGSLPFETPDSDSDEHNPFESEELLDDMRRNRDTTNLTLTEAWEAHANATQEAVRAVGGELLVPHARFFIEKKKSKCTIRFDPPVSGRFILLKIWSSHHDPTSNIDIQSVMARGFAGPRYFPSIEMR